jgi:hypothetical protein
MVSVLTRQAASKHGFGIVDDDVWEIVVVEKGVAEQYDASQQHEQQHG